MKTTATTPMLSDFSEDILEQAADWLDLMESDETYDQTELSQWLTHGAHQQALELMAQRLELPEIHKQLQQLKSAEQNKPLGAPLGKTRAPLALAASVLLVITATLTSGVFIQSKSPVMSGAIALSSTDYAAGIAEPRLITLSDGSQVHLNGDSRIAYTDEASHRRLELRKGEAYFDIAPDRNRPFEVTTAMAKVTVLGTAFNIDTNTDGMTLTVDEGHVQVLAEKRYDLYAGDRISLLLSGQVELTQTDQLNRRDWRSGWYEVNDLSFSQVISQLQRYSSKAIIVTPELATRTKVTGNFDLTRPEDALHLIAELHGLHVTESPHSIYVSL